MIYNMYSEIKSRVVYNGEKSEYFSCDIGVDKEKIFPLFILLIFK